MVGVCDEASGEMFRAFQINDFRPEMSSFFWPIAAFVGFLISFWISARAARSGGIILRRDDGARHGLHWGSLFVVIAAIVFIASQHDLEGWVVAQIITLVVGVTWYLGGLHLDRNLLLPGIVFVVSAPLVDYLAPYPWTIVGIAIAASLIVSALWMKLYDKT